MTKPNPFRYFKTSPEIIRLGVMPYVRFPLSLRNVDELLHERGFEIRHKTVRFWWHRFGPTFASEIRKRRIKGMKSSHWRWHLHEIFVKINGERHYLWRLWIRRMRRLQKFAAVLAAVSKHFNQERSLSSRSHFKANRGAALAEWRGLCAA